MVRYNEIEPHAAAWIRNLIALGELPDGVVDERSIVDVRGDDLDGCDEVHFFAGIGVWARAVAEAERASNYRLRRPLATGSCPCQPLSSAGQRKGHVDERHLWPAFHRLITERRFATVLGEQVAGKDGREWMSAVRHDLEASGYAVGCAVLPAGGYGAPHIRYRMFFVADADGWGQPEVGQGHEAPRGGWAIEPARPGAGGAVRGVDDATGARQPSPRSGEPGQSESRERLPSMGCADSGLADACRVECEPVEGNGGIRGADDGARTASERSGPYRSPMRPSPVNGFWRASDWLFCRDNKWRPIEPGTFPLVDGSAFRLGSGGPYEGKSRAGMLRGYGNAIVLPVAQTFVECALEATR
jgi:DNA (cytosine-5)-methyltransferase 1